MTATLRSTHSARPTRNPGPRPWRIHGHWRTTRVACAVAMAHIALLWSVIQTVQRPEPTPMADIILASVVLESVTQTTRPAQSAASLTAPARPASPVRPLPALPIQSDSTPNASAPATLASVAPTAATAPYSESGGSRSAAQGGATGIGAATPANAAAQPTVVLPSADADYLNNPAPPYPRQSRRLGEEGLVVLRVLIGLQGTAEQAEIRTSSGYDRLDQAALETVQRWRYVPGKRNGTSVAMWFNVPVRFVLE